MTGLIDNDPNLESVLLTPEDLRRRVRELAAEIARDYGGRNQLVLVGVLKGACVFMSDLGRELYRHEAPPLTYEFIRASTYGNDIKAADESDRPVEIAGLGGSLRDRDVLLVEDILDQGFTLPLIRRALIEHERVRSVRTCVLLVKNLDQPSPDVAAIRREFVPDYSGFSIPDRWVAGYGLDVGERYRELPCVVVVREERFRS